MIDLKTLAVIVTFIGSIAVAGGSYFVMQHRVDDLDRRMIREETKSDGFGEALTSIKAVLPRIERALQRLENGPSSAR